MRNIIKQLRKQAGLRQEDMAQALGTSRQTIIAIENNGVVTESIAPDDRFRSGDVLFLAGSKEGLLQVSLWANK